MQTDITHIRIQTMRHLADHFDKLRHVGGSPELDRALWHAAGFMREQATWVEQGKVNIFDDLDTPVGAA